MSKDQCVICMENVSNDTAMTDCRHKFCKKCILKWINECSECPLCRQQITKLRFFSNGFYVGDEICVNYKAQKVPNDDDISNFIDDDSEELSDDDYDFHDVPLKICTSPTCKGTMWKDGHRLTTRSHTSEKPYASILRSMTQELQQSRMKKIEKMNDRLFSELMEKTTNLAKRLSMDGYEMEKFVREICNEERGKNIEITDIYINELNQRLQRKIFRNRLFSSFDNSESLKMKRKLIPLSV